MTVRVLSRETLLLRDHDENWFKVRCAWGVDPGLAFLPAAQDWDSLMPGWLQGRRDEVVRVIRDFGLETAIDDQGLPPEAFGRGDDPDTTAGPEGKVTTLDPIAIEEMRHPPNS